jgi:hypothetical protein
VFALFTDVCRGGSSDGGEWAERNARFSVQL